MSADGDTTEIEVTLPDRLVESIDATVEQSDAYDDRDALFRDAIAAETAGFGYGAFAADGEQPGTTRRAVLDALREEERTHEEVLAVVGEDGHSAADVDETLSILIREGEIYCVEDVYRMVEIVPDGGTESDEFSVFRDKRGAGRGSIEDPSVRVTPNKIIFGHIIHRRILDETEHVEFLIAEDGRVGIQPVEGDDADEPHVYSARGGDVSCRSVWRKLGVEIEERQDLPLDTESRAFPVLDVSEFIDEPGEHPGACEVCGRAFDSERAKNIHKGRTHDVEDSGGEDADDSEGYECGECGKTFDSETGRNIHAGRVHDGDGGSAGSDEPGDKDDQGEQEAEGPVLDHERVATAMDSIGIDEDVPTGEVVAAIDRNSAVYGVSRELDISRADADDLIRRLDLRDAFDSSEDVATGRFEGGQEGAA